MSDMSLHPLVSGMSPMERKGDLMNLITTIGHYVENTGNTTLKFLEVFKSGRFSG